MAVGHDANLPYLHHSLLQHFFSTLLYSSIALLSTLLYFSIFALNDNIFELNSLRLSGLLSLLLPSRSLGGKHWKYLYGEFKPESIYLCSQQINNEVTSIGICPEGIPHRYLLSYTMVLGNSKSMIRSPVSIYANKMELRSFFYLDGSYVWVALSNHHNSVGLRRPRTTYSTSKDCSHVVDQNFLFRKLPT